MYYVYVLILKKGQLYIGFSGDLQKRYNDHKYGKVTFTKSRRPLKLIYYEAYVLKEDAKSREKYLKTTKGKKTIKIKLRRYLSQHTAPSSSG